VFELSTAVVKVDVKVINASLTQNQCLQCVTPHLMHAEIPRPRDGHWTEQWQHDQVARRALPNRTEFINFSEKDLINNDSSFGSLILLANDLQFYVFLFEQLLP